MEKFRSLFYTVPYLQLISDGIGALSLKGLLKEEFSLKAAA